MADILEPVDTTEDVDKSLEKSSSAFEAYRDAGTRAYHDVSDTAKRSASVITGSNDDVDKSLQRGSGSLTSYTNKAKDSAVKMGSVLEEMAKITISSAAAFSNYSRSINEDSKTSSAEAIDNILKLKDNVTKNLPNMDFFKKIGDFSVVTDKLKDLAATSDTIENYRESLMDIAASRGELKSFFEQTGSSLQRLDQFLLKDIETNDRLGATLGKTSSEIEKLNIQFKAVPGFMNEVIKVGESGAQQMSALEAAVLLATASGRKMSEVQEDIAHSMNDYGFSAQKAIEYTSRIAEVSQKGNIPLAASRNILSSVSETFHLYGNNVDAASRMTLKFYDNLKSSGVSLKDTQDIIKSFSASVSNLTLSQKSFLSAQTGGPGGLLGGLQIEKMLSEGKSDEVFDKIKKTIQKQFNGKIMTLGDVKTQEDAAAFTKQRTLLTKGPLGSIVRSDAEASKVLEAFKKGDKPNIGAELPKLTESSTDSLIDPINLGNEISKRGFSDLIDISRSMETSLKKLSVEKGTKAITSLSAAPTMQDSTDDEIRKSKIAAKKDVASKDAASRTTAVKSGYEVTIPGYQRSIDETKDGISGLVLSAESIFSKIVNKALPDSLKSDQQISKKETTPSVEDIVRSQKPIVDKKQGAEKAIKQTETSIPEKEKSLADKALKDIDLTKKIKEAPEESLTDKFKNYLDEVLSEAKGGVKAIMPGSSAEILKDTSKTLSDVSKASSTTDKSSKKSLKDSESVNPEPAPAPQEHKHTIEVVQKGICLDCGMKTKPSSTVLSITPTANIGK